MKLSIVVPVYNVELYVRNCILSIIEQDKFADIELIIVNDGTRDNSVEKIQDLVDKYDNIKLVDQTNQGLSIARNNGMAAAHGDYIWFVDSDDWISQDAISQIWPYLDSCNDTIVMGVIEVEGEEIRTSHTYFNDIITMDGKEAYRKGCQQLSASQYTVYNKSFLRDNNLFFMPNVYHEDNEFSPRVSYMSKRTVYLPFALYYRRSPMAGRDSITSIPRPKRAFDSLMVAASLSTFELEYVKEPNIIVKFNEHISVVINNALSVIVKNSKDQQQKFNDIYHTHYWHLNKHLANAKWKNRIEAFLFKLFPNNIVQIYRFVHIFNIRFL